MVNQNKWRTAIPAGAGILLFLGLCFYRINDISLWLDEIMSMDFCDGDVSELFQSLKQDVHAPLFYSLLFVYLKIAELSELSGRLHAILAGAACIPAIYYLGRECRNRKAGIAAAIILSVSPFFIEYSREVHPYSLSALFSVLSWIFFLRIVRRGETRDAIGYGLSCGLLLLTFYLAILVIFSQFLVFLALFPKLARRKKNRLIFAWIGGAVLFSPWLPIFVRQFTVNKISHDVEVYFPEGVQLRHVVRLISDIFLGEGRSIIPFALLAGFAPMIALGGTLIQVTEKRQRFAFCRLLNIWMFWGLALLFTLLCLIKPLFLSRYMTMSIPLAAFFLASAVTRLRIKIGYIFFALIIAWSLFSYTIYIKSMPRQNWKQPAAHLAENAEDKDVIVTGHINATSCLIFYYQMLDRAELNKNTFTFDHFYELTEGKYKYSDRTLWYLWRGHPWSDKQLETIQSKNTFIKQIDFPLGYRIYTFRGLEETSK